MIVGGSLVLIEQSCQTTHKIAMGTGVAWLYSAVAALVPWAFRAGFSGAVGTVATYFVGAAVVTAPVQLWRVLELHGREQTQLQHGGNFCNEFNGCNRSAMSGTGLSRLMKKTDGNRLLRPCSALLSCCSCPR
jgi:hypothetical protein